MLEVGLVRRDEFRCFGSNKKGVVRDLRSFVGAVRIVVLITISLWSFDDFIARNRHCENDFFDLWFGLITGLIRIRLIQSKLVESQFSIADFVFLVPVQTTWARLEGQRFTVALNVGVRAEREGIVLLFSGQRHAWIWNRVSFASGAVRCSSITNADVVLFVIVYFQRMAFVSKTTWVAGTR